MKALNRPAEGAERRRANRAALRLSATIREAGRSRTTVRLIDVSTHGCRIEASAAMTVDSWLWLSIAGLEAQYCRVVWQCHEFAGLEFATPLNEAVLDRLLDTQEQLSEATIKELRQIANRTHNLAAKQDSAETQALAELSRKCAVEAVVEGFRRADAAPAKRGRTR